VNGTNVSRLTCQREADRERSLRCAPSRLKDRCDRGAVGRTGTDVMQSHDTLGIDEDVSPELRGVRLRGPRPSAVHQLPRVCAPSRRSPDVAKAPSKHAVRVIQGSYLIDEEGPRDTGLLNVCART
jgi:hypothetical protein